jgi:hypothetical protein
MVDFCTRNAPVLLFVVPALVVFFTLISERLGIDRELRKGRFNIRGLLFSTVFAALVYALAFFLSFAKVIS